MKPDPTGPILVNPPPAKPSGVDLLAEALTPRDPLIHMASPFDTPGARNLEQHRAQTVTIIRTHEGLALQSGSFLGLHHVNFDTLGVNPDALRKVGFPGEAAGTAEARDVAVVEADDESTARKLTEKLRPGLAPLSSSTDLERPAGTDAGQALAPDTEVQDAIDSCLQLRIGELVAGRFQIIRLLGRGGHAVVFRAHDRVLDRSVALKFMPLVKADVENRAGAFDALRREVTMMQQLRHPNIAAVYDLHLFRGTPFLSMQYLRGRTLHETLARLREPPPFERVVRWAQEILGALQAAHEQGITHRDLKPLNVMVGPDDRCMVFDFGIARVADQAHGLHEETIIGTPAVMGPELIDREAYPVRDHRIDLYAFGVVLFSIITRGKLPIHRDNPVELLLAQVLESPQLVTRYRPDTPEVLQRIILGCLIKDPRKRFPTADLIRTALRSFQPAPAPLATTPAMRGLRRLVLVEPEEARRRLLVEAMNGSQRKVHAYERLDQALPLLEYEVVDLTVLSGRGDRASLDADVQRVRAACADRPCQIAILGGRFSEPLPEVEFLLADPVSLDDFLGLLHSQGAGRAEISDVAIPLNRRSDETDPPARGSPPRS